MSRMINRKMKEMKLKMIKEYVLVGIICAVILSGCALLAEVKPTEKSTSDGLVVGLFDSRAVAVAYVRSGRVDDAIKEKEEEMKEAEKVGDKKKIAELNAWGEAIQHKHHLQGFGTASVKDLLVYIEEDIPKVAKEAGVDIIVSKWDLVYEKKGAKVVDVTEMLIRGFEPNEKTLKIIRELKKHKPLPDEVIEKHKH